MGKLNLKILACAILALACIGVSACCVLGYSPFGITQGDILTAGLAIAPIAAISIPQLDINQLKVVSAEEFQKLQAKYGKLYVLDIHLDETESYQYIAKRPTRQLLNAIADNKDDLDKANDMMIKNMIVAGDTDALDDGIVYSRLIGELATIMQQGRVFLSKA